MVAYFNARSSGQGEANYEEEGQPKQQVNWSRLKRSAFRTQGDGQYCTCLLDISKSRNFSIEAAIIESFRISPLFLPVTVSQSRFKVTQTQSSRITQQLNNYHNLYVTVNILPSNIPRRTGSRKDGARPAFFPIRS